MTIFNTDLALIRVTYTKSLLPWLIGIVFVSASISACLEVETRLEVATPTRDVNSNLPGRLRTNPLPFGKTINHSGMAVTVLETNRGVTPSGLFSSPEEAHEWIEVKLWLKNRGSRDETRNYHTSDFRIVGTRGIIYGRLDFRT